MAFYFVNRLDVDQAMADIVHAIRTAPAYSGFIRVHWSKRTQTALHSERRADDTRLLSYAFEAGDHYLAYNLGHLQAAEAARLGDAVDRGLRRLPGVAVEVRLEMSAFEPAALHVVMLRFKRPEDIEAFREANEFKNLR